MVIHFSLKPVNISGTKTIVHHYGSTSETTEDVAYDYYSPYSWFEVTVRNKDTGQILGQSGFGNARGNQYPQNVNMTLKVLNRGDMHVELEGNYITATVDVSVKKKENIE